MVEMSMGEDDHVDVGAGQPVGQTILEIGFGVFDGLTNVDEDACDLRVLDEFDQVQ